MRPIVNMSEKDRATDICNMHKKLVKIARVVSEISWRRDTQTDRLTHHNIILSGNCCTTALLDLGRCWLNLFSLVTRNWCSRCCVCDSLNLVVSGVKLWTVTESLVRRKEVERIAAKLSSFFLLSYDLITVQSLTPLTTRSRESYSISISCELHCCSWTVLNAPLHCLIDRENCHQRRVNSI